jgi:hypothetical protein
MVISSDAGKGIVMQICSPPAVKAMFHKSKGEGSNGRRRSERMDVVVDTASEWISGNV